MELLFGPDPQPNCIPSDTVLITEYLLPSALPNNKHQILFYFMCFGVLPWCQAPWNWSYRTLWAAMWMLGIKPEYSGRAAGTLNCQAVSPAPEMSSSLSAVAHGHLNSTYFHHTHTDNKNSFKGLGWLAGQLRVLTALADEPELVSSSHKVWLTTAYNVVHGRRCR